MNYLLHFIKNYPFSCLCIAAIWVLCLMPVPELPLKNVRFIDKWTHFVMYGGTCAVIWWEYWRQHLRPDYEKLFFWAWLSPVVMSGVLELLQQYCTGGHRSGDWFDLLANAVGATIGAVIGILLLKFFPKG